MRSEDEWFCQKCSTGNCWSRTDCRHCSSVTNKAAELPQTSIQEKISILEKMGNEEPVLAGRRLLEKGLERHQKKLNGPKKTAKHIEAKQNWINRETKRIVAEMQEHSRVRNETLRAAYEELRKSEVIWCRRASWWTRTGATSCSWRVWRQRNEWLAHRETQRRRRSPAGLWKRTESRWRFLEKMENPRGGREGIHRERHQDVRRHGRTGWLAVIVEVQASMDVASNIRGEKFC